MTRPHAGWHRRGLTHHRHQKLQMQIQCLALSAGPLSSCEQPRFPDPQVLWSQRAFSLAPAASHGEPAPARGTCPEGVSQPQSGSELFRVGQHADWGLLHGDQRRGAPGPWVPVTFSISRKHLPPCPESGGTEAPRRFQSSRSAQALWDPMGRQLPGAEKATWPFAKVIRLNLHLGLVQTL